MTRASTLQLIGRSISTWEEWRRSDPEWAKRIDSLREGIASARQRGVDGGNQGLSFAAWRKKFLGQDTFRHQQAWVDLLEGRPYTPVEGETYEPADPNRLIINVPPFHCAEVSTPVLTADGWKTIGEVTDSDFLIGEDGYPAPVYETWTPENDEDVDLYEVRFNTGDVITTDGAHLWEVSGTQGKRKLVTTAWLAANPRYSGRTKWRVHMAKPVQFEPRELPLDPYLFGYWLGDGDSGSSRFAVSDEDAPDLLRHLDAAGFTCKVARDSRGGSDSVYVHKMRHLLPLGNKHVPVEYMLASAEQRLALLQGLMDSDGTINPKDGRASFVQVDEDIARDVYRLVASLGMQPRIRHEKQGTTAPNGTPNSERIWRVYFKPNGEEIFRLERKQRNVRVTAKGAKTNNRTIDSVVPAGRGRVRCVSVMTDGNKFLIGDGLVPTRNAKSQTMTVEYVTYRICMNPNVRVIIVSKRVDQARKFLYSIKQRLTSNQWAPLQAAYAPEGGFKPNRYDGATWGADRIYVNGIDSGEKDPTVEALGLGGQIYGSRADLIIIDDGIVSSNASQYESQITWLESEVENRAFDGKILVIGTRLATTDLYSELPRGDRYLSGRSPWTVLRQPAVLAYAEDPKDWVTLWPRTTRPMETGQSPDADGTYEAWDGPRLNRVRDAKPPRVWSLVYQQAEVADDATFDPLCVNGSVDRRRKPGPLIAGAWGHPRNGAEGQYVIASMDPAMAGDTFTLVGSVDRTTKIRRVLNCWVQTSPTPAYIRGLIRDVTEEFGVHEWVIEQNAFQLFLVHDEAIQEYCRNRGVRITPHYTSRNKQDPDFGVASVAPLFGSTRRINEGAGRAVHAGDNLIWLPDPDKSVGVKTLIEELVAWQPGKLGKQLRQDGPMALWFFELRARAILLGADGSGSRKPFMDNPYLSRGDRRNQVVVPVDFLERAYA